MATKLINPARRASSAELLASLPRLERASRTLAVFNCELLQTFDAAGAVENGIDVAVAWATIERIAPWEQITGAIAVVEELVPDDDGSAEAAMRVVLAERYRTVRPFVGLLAESVSLTAAAGGAQVLVAVRAPPDLAARKVRLKPLRPEEIDGAWRYVYRAVDQFGQFIDVTVSEKRDLAAARRFFTRALNTTTLTPVEVITDKAAVYPGVVEELAPGAWHHTEPYANNRIEADHSQLKRRSRPMRGLKTDRATRIVTGGHGFVQNIRHGHYELGTEKPVNLRVTTAFDELALAI